MRRLATLAAACATSDSSFISMMNTPLPTAAAPASAACCGREGGVRTHSGKEEEEEESSEGQEQCGASSPKLDTRSTSPGYQPWIHRTGAHINKIHPRITHILEHRASSLGGEGPLHRDLSRGKRRSTKSDECHMVSGWFCLRAPQTKGIGINKQCQSKKARPLPRNDSLWVKLGSLGSYQIKGK